MAFTKSSKKPAAKAPVKKGVASKTKKVVRRKPPTFTYKAPAELKSHFVEVGFSTGKDHLISPDEITMESIKGNPENENAVRFDLLQEDLPTALALLTRLNYRMFAPNALKRPTANSSFLVLIRVSVTQEGLIRSRVKTAWYINAKGKWAEFTDKKNLDYRKIRMASRFLAGAFTHARSQADMLASYKAQQAEERKAQREAEKEEAREAKKATSTKKRK